MSKKAKYIITERQYRLLNEEPEEILEIPFKMFSNDWKLLQEYLDRLGNPPYKIVGDLDLNYLEIKSLGNLTLVKGNLLLIDSKIESLGNLTRVNGSVNISYSSLEDLGKLEYIGEFLMCESSQLKSLGNLKYVGQNLNLNHTPLSKIIRRIDLRDLIEVGGRIFI